MIIQRQERYSLRVVSDRIDLATPQMEEGGIIREKEKYDVEITVFL